MEKVVAGRVYINIAGTKNKMTTVMWETHVNRAFFLPSALWFLKEYRMMTYETMSMRKLAVQRIPLLATKRRLTKYVSEQASFNSGCKSQK